VSEAVEADPEFLFGTEFAEDIRELNSNVSDLIAEFNTPKLALELTKNLSQEAEDKSDGGAPLC